MAGLGPFELAPALAVAVSGGADSMALALLAHGWAAGQGGSVLALVVDHRLRPESGAEAELTMARLARRGIAARLLVLDGLVRGPGLAARARAARHAALAEACRQAGLLHLLLGHHAGDQAETVLMRRRAGSGARGLAGVAGLAEARAVRLLRPLLAEPPGRLRGFLQACGQDWVEDPSNRDPATLRARLRAELDDPAGEGPEVAALLTSARADGAARAAAERDVARELAARVRLHPAGWAVLGAGPLSAAALSALVAALAGRRYPAATAQVAALAAAPRAATLAGVRLLPAGRLGAAGDWLVVREAAAMAPPVPAVAGATWDGRFRLAPSARPAPGLTLGALGAAASGLRRLRPGWPAAVLHALPALWDGARLAAVPALGYPDVAGCAAVPVLFSPALPLAPAEFRPI